MKTLLFTILLCLGLNTAQAQQFNRPDNPEKNFGFFGGPYTQVNLVDYFEYGIVAGVNMKDIFLVGPYYQRSIKGNDFYGLYTQININPKEYYFNIGFAARTGLVNGKYFSIEPAMTIQHNGMNDKYKITHQIGFTGGLPSYNFGIIFGNFGMKWWENPEFKTGYNKGYDQRFGNME